MPFIMSGLGPRCSVPRGVTIPEGDGQLWGEHLPDKPNTPMNCDLDWSNSDMHTIGVDNWLPALDESTIGHDRWGWDFTCTAGESDIYDCRVTAVNCKLLFSHSNIFTFIGIENRITPMRYSTIQVMPGEGGLRPDGILRLVADVGKRSYGL